MTNQRDYGDREIAYPVTITLVADPANKMKMFFCPTSQTPVLQYKGLIISILPGLSIYEPYTLIKCKDSRCPMAFIFSPIVEMSKKYIMNLDTIRYGQNSSHEE